MFIYISYIMGHGPCNILVQYHRESQLRAEVLQLTGLGPINFNCPGLCKELSALRSIYCLAAFFLQPLGLLLATGVYTVTEQLTQKTILHLTTERHLEMCRHHSNRYFINPPRRYISSDTDVLNSHFPHGSEI